MTWFQNYLSSFTLLYLPFEDSTVFYITLMERLSFTGISLTGLWFEVVVPFY